MEIKKGTATELIDMLNVAIAKSKDHEVPIHVEDENGRLENVTYVWYDKTRHMIRMSVGGVEFSDSPDCE